MSVIERGIVAVEPSIRGYSERGIFSDTSGIIEAGSPSPACVPLVGASSPPEGVDSASFAVVVFAAAAVVATGAVVVAIAADADVTAGVVAAASDTVVATVVASVVDASTDETSVTSDESRVSSLHPPNENSAAKHMQTASAKGKIARKFNQPVCFWLKLITSLRVKRGNL
jgi:hypothetical protein